MITRKSLTIPIFGFRLKIFIFDDKKELLGYLPEEDLKLHFNGISYGEPFSGTVAINSKCQSTITHEAVHITDFVWKSIGYTPDRDNDEVTAYLLTYIYEKIYDVFIAHNNKKSL